MRTLALVLSLAAVVSTAALADGTELVETMTKPDEDVNTAALEIRLGGGHEPLPHAVWVIIEAGGRVFERSKPLQADPKSVAQLLDVLSASGLCDIDQESFDEALREASELNKSLRGGTGVYTISFPCNGHIHNLTLNRPSLYTNSAVPEARDFAAIIALVKRIVKHGTS